jgi:hypothetical protein
MTAPHDAQRELEQRALRNVRGLVDKVEGQADAEKRAGRRMLKGLAIAAVVAFAAFAGLFAYLSGNRPGTTVTIEQKR